MRKRNVKYGVDTADLAGIRKGKNGDHCIGRGIYTNTECGGDM